MPVVLKNPKGGTPTTSDILFHESMKFYNTNTGLFAFDTLVMVINFIDKYLLYYTIPNIQLCHPEWLVIHKFLYSAKLDINLNNYLNRKTVLD